LILVIINIDTPYVAACGHSHYDRASQSLRGSMR
jgi:hypothetical protein